MRYGIALPITGVDGDVRKLVEVACLAEEAGWDGVFLEDYIIYYGERRVPVFDPWVTLAAMAMRTKRIRLGITVTPLARRRPWKVARESVTLDHLSKGRLILGVGLGDSHDRSFANFGEEIDARRRVRMLDQALEVIAGLWSGRKFRYQGAHYQVKEATFLASTAAATARSHLGGRRLAQEDHGRARGPLGRRLLLQGAARRAPRHDECC